MWPDDGESCFNALHQQYLVGYLLYLLYLHLLQPLDVTLNGHCKSFIKGMFAEWYRKQVEEALPHGKKIDIDAKFYLTVTGCNSFHVLKIEEIWRDLRKNYRHF